MSDMRDIRDRNDVYFGMPDMDVEREINYLKDDVQRKVPAVDSVVPGTQVQPRVVSPPVPGPFQKVFELNGLTSSPKVHLFRPIVEPAFNSIDLAVDSSNQLGLGAGVVYALSSNVDSVGAQIYDGFVNEPLGVLVAINPTTNTVTSLGTPFNDEDDIVPCKLYIVNDCLIGVSYVGGDPIYRFMWNSTTPEFIDMAEPTLEHNEIYSVIYAYGQDYLMTDAGEVYDTFTPGWVGAVTLPEPEPGASVSIIGSGPYVWAQTFSATVADCVLYSGNSDDEPTWVERQANAYEFVVINGSVMPDTGELIVLTSNFPVSQGIRSYGFSTGTRVDRDSIFSPTGELADGEPFQVLSIKCGPGYVLFGLVQSEEYMNTGLPIDYVPTVRKMSGRGSTLQSTSNLLATLNTSIWPSSGVIQDRNARVYSGSGVGTTRAYTWVGAHLGLNGFPVGPSINVQSFVAGYTV
jgi:hypothetical protein